MAALVLFCVAAPRSQANGGSLKVFLGYLPEVSNWGAFESHGVAEVNIGEGEAHLTVHRLPYDPRIYYQAWVVPAGDWATMVSLGSFEVDETGHADVTLKNPGLPPRVYRFLVITAEPVPDEDPAPDSRRAIAGVFPNSMARPVPTDSPLFAELLTTPVTIQAPSAEAGQPVEGEKGPELPEMTGTTSPPANLPVTGGKAMARPLDGRDCVLAGIVGVALLVALWQRHHPDPIGERE